MQIIALLIFIGIVILAFGLTAYFGYSQHPEPRKPFQLPGIYRNRSYEAEPTGWRPAQNPSFRRKLLVQMAWDRLLHKHPDAQNKHHSPHSRHKPAHNRRQKH